MWTPLFQRTLNIGTRSPKPVTESVRPPDTVKPNGPSAAASVASTETVLRPTPQAAPRRPGRPGTASRTCTAEWRCEIGVRVQFCAQVAREICGDLPRIPGAQTRRRRRPSPTCDRDGRERESRHQRRRRQAAEKAGNPEAHAAFVRFRELADIVRASWPGDRQRRVRAATALLDRPHPRCHSLMLPSCFG